MIHKATASGAKGKVSTKVIAKSVQVSLKWLSVKTVYVFISRQDTQEDVFIHQTAITWNNPDKYQLIVGDAKRVEFNEVQGKQCTEATNMTRPAG